MLHLGWMSTIPAPIEGVVFRVDGKEIGFPATTYNPDSLPGSACFNVARWSWFIPHAFVSIVTLRNAEASFACPYYLYRLLMDIEAGVHS